MHESESETNSDDEREDECSDSEYDCSDSESDAGPSNGKHCPIDADYMESIRNILVKNSEVKFANCLELNKHMQQQLQVIREHLQSLLKGLEQRYKDNELALKRNQQKKSHFLCMKGAYLRGGTFYFKGNMFFRDARNRCCPNNPDYIRRSAVEAEMFPMDFELRSRHVWSVADKVAVVQALKQQITTYLDDQSSRQALLPTVEKLKGKVSAHSNTIVQLLATVDDKFAIDWGEISAHNLRNRHSPTSCKAMWNVYLKPSLRRSEWTDAENLRLVDAVQTCRYQDWQRIADLVGQRSDFQCFVQFITTAYQLVPQATQRWDASQDDKLLRIIEESKVNGLIKWNRVMIHFPNKSKSTIQQRYFYSLNPNVTHAHFTPEEDLILLAAVEEYGTKFSCFPRTLFPNRSTVQLRSRYRNILETRHKQTPWSVEDDQKLIDFIAEHGLSDWNRCAQVLGNHNRTSCRTRFLTIKKFLEQNPTKSVADIPRRKLRKAGSNISTMNWLDKVNELRKDPTAEIVETKSPSHKPPQPAVELDELESEVVQQPKRNDDEQATSDSDASSADSSASSSILRSIEKDFHDVYKYAYHFKIDHSLRIKEPNPRTLKRIHLYSDILKFRASRTKAFKYNLLMPQHLQDMYANIFGWLREVPMAPKQRYLIPPRFPLLLGWRTLSIHQMEEDESADMDAPTKSCKKRKQHEAVTKFRTRFRSLFYKSALLSQLECKTEKVPVPNSDDVQLLIAEKRDKFQSDLCGNVKRKQEMPTNNPNSVAKRPRLG